MRRGTFTIAAVAFVCFTAAAAPLVTYESPCECRDNHGKHRWAEKNDPSQPPKDASAIQAVTPSDIFNWQGPTEHARGVGFMVLPYGQSSPQGMNPTQRRMRRAPCRNPRSKPKRRIDREVYVEQFGTNLHLDSELRVGRCWYA
jgi:hypothetical protein